MPVSTSTASYATIDDLPIYGLNSAVLATLPPAQHVAALIAASDLIDSYLGSRFKLPLTTWGTAIVQKTCEIAAWTLLSIRGFDPEDPGDAEVKSRYDVAMAWLVSIAEGEVSPNVIDSAAIQGQPSGPGILQSNVQPSSQPSPSGTLFITNMPDGTIITTGQPRQRGWR